MYGGPSGFGSNRFGALGCSPAIPSVILPGGGSGSVPWGGPLRGFGRGDSGNQIRQYPLGSVAFVGLFVTYRYRFGSPVLNPIPSGPYHRPAAGSYSRARLYCNPRSASHSRPVYRYSSAPVPVTVAAPKAS
jgi:hypothetical protein